MRYLVVQIILSVFFSGCATIVSKTHYRVPVNCNERNAVVKIYKDNRCIRTVIGPTQVELCARGGFFSPAKYYFEFLKEGYSSDRQTLRAELDPWYIGNVIFGGLVGLCLIDPATGAMWKFDEDDGVYGNIVPIRE